MYTITKCYEIVTQESAEDGDAAEIGYVGEGGWKYALRDDEGHHDEVLDEAKDGVFECQFETIDDVVDYLRYEGACDPSGSVSINSPLEHYGNLWLSTYPEQDPFDASWTTYSFHFGDDFLLDEVKAVLIALNIVK